MTTENNILIALFMEAKQYDKEDNYIYFDETNTMFSNDTISIKDLKFHSDWNWLMEVVEKIERLNYRFEVIGVNSLYTRVRIENNIKSIVSTKEDFKIQAVYNACLEFIKYYNEQTR